MVIVADKLAEPRQLILTANQDTVYMSGVFDLREGPMAMELPPGLLGWRFGAKRNSAVLAGYRHRELEYGKADVLDVEKTLTGFVLGLKIGF